MPKMKTQKSIARRVKKTGSGKLMYRKRRLGSKGKKRAKTRYSARRPQQLDKSQRKNVERTAPGV